MSGGSYNYLYAKKIPAGEEAQDDLRRMVERLRNSGYYAEASQTADFLNGPGPTDTLREVWRAVEWCDSCDTSESDIARAVVKHRGGTWIERK